MIQTYTKQYTHTVRIIDYTAPCGACSFTRFYYFIKIHTLNLSKNTYNNSFTSKCLISFFG